MRIVIAEDQVLLRDGLTRLLRDDGHRVLAEVGDARSLVEAVNRHRPDLLLADIRMPPGNGDDGARAVGYLRRRLPELAVMMLTQLIDPGLVLQIAHGRVDRFGYLLKDRVLQPETFCRQLSQVAAGGTVIDPAVLRSADGSRMSVLTEREAEVLARVAAGRSNSGIAEDLVISRRTVDAHLRAIFGKLEIAAGPEENQRVLAVLRWLTESGMRRTPAGFGSAPDL